MARNLMSLAGFGLTLFSLVGSSVTRLFGILINSYRKNYAIVMFRNVTLIVKMGFTLIVLKVIQCSDPSNDTTLCS